MKPFATTIATIMACLPHSCQTYLHPNHDQPHGFTLMEKKSKRQEQVNYHISKGALYLSAQQKTASASPSISTSSL
jgi:hypothetical protein